MNLAIALLRMAPNRF